MSSGLRKSGRRATMILVNETKMSIRNVILAFWWVV